MMGQSGGRSGGSRVGQGARRRNTQRERSYVDPVRDADDWEDVEGEFFPGPRLTPLMVCIYTGMAVAGAAAFVSLVFTAIWLATVVGVIGQP